MVEIAGTGDNGFETSAIQEARSFLATIVSALATIGNELYQWFLSLGNRLMTYFSENPDKALMLGINLLILFS
jgi:hypothetical protein